MKERLKHWQTTAAGVFLALGQVTEGVDLSTPEGRWKGGFALATLLLGAFAK